MSDYDLTPAEVAAGTRLDAYNIGSYDATTNPYGFGNDGHVYNQMRQATDAKLYGLAAKRFANAALADVTTAVATTAANVALTHEDEQNTAADRTATGQDVVTTATNVLTAKDWASKSVNSIVSGGLYSARHYAQKAADSAAGFNIPAVSAADALKFLQVKADGTGYQLGTITTATLTEAKAGTGTGYVNASILGGVLAEIRPVAGDLLTTFSNAADEDWLLANAGVVTQAAYPALFTAIGHFFDEFATAATGSIAGTGIFANANSRVRYANSLTFLLTGTTTPADHLWWSSDEGVSFTKSLGDTNAVTGYIAEDIFYLGGKYVLMPSALYDQGAYLTYRFSTDGKTGWTAGPGLNGTALGADTGQLKSAASPTCIVAARLGTGRLIRFTSFTTTAQPTDQAISESIIDFIYGGGKFVAISNTAKVASSSDDGVTYTAFSLLPGGIGSFSAATLRYTNGKFWLFATNGTTFAFMTSTDGVNWTVVRSYLQTDVTSLPDENPSNVIDISWDGDRYVIITSSGRIFFTKNFISFYVAAFRISQISSSVVGIVLSPNSKIITVDPAVGGITLPSAAGVKRAALQPVRATEFQLPKITAKTPAQTYIRGK